MKKKNYFLLLTFIMLLFVYKGYSQIFCLDTAVVNAASSDAFNDYVNRFKAKGRHLNTDLKVIPVVIHVIYRNNADRKQITMERIEQQIEVTNKQLRRLNANASETRRIFRPVAADCNVQVALATRKPDGRRFNGVQYHYYPNVDTIGGGPQFNEDLLQIQTETSIDPDRYLNVWIMPVVHQAAASFPWDRKGVADGFWIGSPIFGITGSNLSPLQNKGATFTHELGHYLGLWHTFQNGLQYLGQCELAHDGSIYDFCGDTPLDWRFHTNIPDERDLGKQFCEDGSLLLSQTENYMFYNADRWLNMFSKDQRARMRACLADLRSKLVSPINLFLTGVRIEDCRDFRWVKLWRENSTQEDDILVQENNKPENDISIFPNPTSSVIHFGYNGAPVANMSIMVYNQMGTKLKEVQSGSAINELNIESFADGVYYVAITIDGVRVTKCIVKAGTSSSISR